MPIDERSISLPEQWAKDAQTVIPAPPVPGIAYRNTAITPEQWAHGQDYSRVADSAQWNQMFWVMSGLLQSAEQYGVMPFSSFTEYKPGSLALGQNGTLYQAILPSGPTQGGTKEPSANPSYWATFGSLGGNLTKFQTAGTFSFTVPGSSGIMRRLLVILFGGGGGGTSSALTNLSCGSGGSGEIVIWRTALQGGTIVPITVGKGGAALMDTESPDGGTTSFGSYMSAAGGKGGGPRQYYGGSAKSLQVANELRLPGFTGCPGMQNINLVGRAAMGGGGGGFGGGRSLATSSNPSPTPPIPGFGGGGYGGSVTGAVGGGTTIINGSAGASGGVYIFY